jgi:hypothetical protein
MHRILLASLAMVLPLACLGADDERPACGSQNQGRLWPEAANRDSKLMSHLMRCGELFICVRGVWHYHWEAPSIRLDQLARHSGSDATKSRSAKSQPSKPAVCEEQAAAVVSEVSVPPPAGPEPKSPH